MSRHRTKPDPTLKRLPGGIPYIIGNEVAERFSFYGMKGILTVYMTKHLLDSAGQPDFMGDDEAKKVYHLFTAAAYFFPLIGSPAVSSSTKTSSAFSRSGSFFQPEDARLQASVHGRPAAQPASC